MYDRFNYNYPEEIKKRRDCIIESLQYKDNDEHFAQTTKIIEMNNEMKIVKIIFKAHTLDNVNCCQPKLNCTKLYSTQQYDFVILITQWNKVKHFV